MEKLMSVAVGVVAWLVGAIVLWMIGSAFAAQLPNDSPALVRWFLEYVWLLWVVVGLVASIRWIGNGAQ